MKPKATVALALFPVLLAVLLVVAACGGETTATQAVTTTAQPVTTSQAAIQAVTTATDAVTTTTPLRSLTTESHPLETRLPNGLIGGLGYVHEVVDIGDYHVVHVTYVQMLTGEEATAAAIEDGVISQGEDLPNDYYLRKMKVTEDLGSKDPGQLEHPANQVSPTALITTATFGAGPDQTVSWEQFCSFFSLSPPKEGEHLSEALWWFERDAETGEFLSIAERPLP